MSFLNKGMLNVSVDYRASVNFLDGHFQNVRSDERAISYMGRELKFRLSLVPGEDVTREHSNRINVVLECRSKARKDVRTQVQLTVIKHRKRKLLADLEWVIEDDKPEVVLTNLPETMVQLERMGYLALDKKCIHLMVDIQINSKEFKGTDGEFEFDGEGTIVDAVGLELYKSPNRQRKGESVKFISKDKGFYHVHKHILTTMSEWFENAFANNTYFESYDLRAISSGEMHEMLLFLYSKQISTDFWKVAEKILPVADRFGFEQLKSECVKSIISRVDEMSMEEMFKYIEVGVQKNCPTLKTAILNTLADYIKYQPESEVPDVLLLKAIRVSNDNGAPMLKSSVEIHLENRLKTFADRGKFKQLMETAKNYGFKSLMKTCGSWFKKNFKHLKEIGFVEDLYQDVVFRNFVLKVLIGLREIR